MSNLKDKLEKARIQAADEYIEEKTREFTQNETNNAVFALGAIGAIDKLATNLSAASLNALISFQQLKQYEALGFPNFVEFLENSPHSPMSKKQFYDRKGILEKEGENTFDLLNSLEVSVSKRKLLGKGSVEIEDGKLFVADDSGEKIEFELNDKRSIIEAISALADANADKSKQIIKAETQRDKFKEAVLKAEKEIERVKSEKSVPVEATYSASLVAVLTSIANLAGEAQKLTAVEKSKLSAPTFEEIQNRLNLLRVAFGNQPLTEVKYSDEALNDDELRALMD